ncbi:MAG: hypothetical protein QOJ91_3045 [Sphingomonadales bacterium]|jgi:hypothetical protein|nr:hypothetical protein [Sphingomonadales bacterium]
MRLLPLLLLVSACAATDAGPSSGETDLARTLSGRSAGELSDCVPTSLSSGLAVRGPRTLIVERGDTIWVNRLAAACPGLRETSQIVIELQGNQYCRGDRFQARDAGPGIAGPICVLDRFTPYRR